ncbi:MAG: hypothetical protein HZC36_13340 [Armatimonadetes bacterium]|nr:hypothetical protein [Armatimonadota bacterium]
MVAPGTSKGRIEFISFRGKEALAYTSFAARVGVSERCEGILRGVFASRKTCQVTEGGSILHGGSDVELALKIRLADRFRLTFQGGVALPATPTQSDSVLTAGLMGEAKLASATCYLNPKAVFIDHNAIVGIGLGINVPVRESAQFVGEFTPIISGDNTRSTTTGARQRRNTYSFAFRFLTGQDRNVSIDLGYTNSLGATTGFSMTPGLGNSGALFIAVTSR